MFVVEKMRNDHLTSDLEIMTILNQVGNYIRSWKEHLGRIDFDRIQKVALNCYSKGKWDRRRPRKRWIEAGTGLNSQTVLRDDDEKKTETDSDFKTGKMLVFKLLL